MSQIKRLIENAERGDCHVCGARNVPVSDFPTLKLKACICCLLQPEIEKEEKEEKGNE